MHTPGPWRAVRAETTDYYTHSIETAEGHVASIAGWSAVGTICPTTEANARLIEHAPDLAFALEALLDWEEGMGGWDAPCWHRARRVLAHATEPATPVSPVLPVTARELLNEAGHGQARNEHTELSLLLGFLDVEIRCDPAVAARLQTHLREAVSVTRQAP